MEDRYIATVDLGTSKLALSVAKITGDNAEILYYRERPSDGIRYGCIYNPTKASIPLKEAIQEAEEELSIKITQVVIGVPRYGVTQEVAGAKLERTDAESCISQEEIDNIKDMALDSYPLDNPEKQEIYGAAAQSFSTDDVWSCTESDVVGMPSAVLQGNFKIFVGLKKASRNIDIMLNKADVAPARKYFLPPITADAVLSSEERENGVAIIEMGAGVTSVTVYEGGILRYYYAIPFGGRTITNDIKLECGFNENLAENIKLGFGACMPEKLLSMSDKILQIIDEENGSDQQLPVKYLSEIITSRVREIVDAILFQIQESGYADRLRNGVVLTGGCANLAACANLIKEMSGYNVRIGFPRAKKFAFSGFPGISDTGAVSTIGMLLYARNDKHLNCIEELVSSAKKEETAQEEKVDNGGTVFDPATWEVKEPEKPKKAKTEKENFLIKWTKKAVKPVEDFVGGLYDKMEDN
ncbi:MAG: cell division protein FtsA [Bacteroidales bacterium]|nr:cell division protein FtsA [Bacteroidales bacterium]